MTSLFKKYYEVRQDLSQWDVNKITEVVRDRVFLAGIRFDHWRRTVELKKLGTEDWCDASLHHDYNAVNPSRITNGDINLTTNLARFTELDQQLFGGTGRRGRVVDGVGVEEPAMTDDQLAELVPRFKGTIVEELHNYMQDKFQAPIRIRCQNRTVNGTSQGLYWHKDDPVENRFHIPLWTNPGHVLLFSARNFKWKAGFDQEEAQQPMDFVGHYIPADGRVYEIFTKDYMHSVASVGVGWYQPREEQTRCHLSFWVAKN
jgi:hypothetical protein